MAFLLLLPPPFFVINVVDYWSIPTLLFLLLFSLILSFLLSIFKERIELLRKKKFSVFILLISIFFLHLGAGTFGVKCGYTSPSELYESEECECFGIKTEKIGIIGLLTPTAGSFSCLGICYSCKYIPGKQTEHICQFRHCPSLDYRFDSASLPQIKYTMWCAFGLRLYPPEVCPTEDKCYKQPISESCNSSAQSFSPFYPEKLRIECSFKLRSGETCEPDKIENGWVKCCENPSLENCNCRLI